MYGGKGEVVGPATGERSRHGVASRFPGNTIPVECYLDQLSRAAPPTTLLGGYRVGDEVFYTGASQTFRSGNRLVYGGKGEVVGPATGEEVSTGVSVQFPGNTDPVECSLDQLSRAAPPTTLLGGYRVGDEVFYTGAGYTFPSGNRLVYGGKGEVVGPATGEAVQGQVASPCSSRGTRAASSASSPAQPRGAPDAAPGGYRVGDEVFFTGASQTCLSGDRLVYGGKGEVVGPATVEKTKDNGVGVRVPGEHGPRRLLPHPAQPLGAPDDAPRRLPRRR